MARTLNSKHLQCSQKSRRDFLQSHLLFPFDSHFLTLLLNILSPARCFGCLQENTWLCNTCRRLLLPPPPECPLCRKKSTSLHLCRQCRKKTSLSGLLSASSYQSASIRRGIHWLKFKGIKDIAPCLAELLVTRLLIIAPIPYLQKHAAFIPIPLHQKKLRQRGYNQSFLLARSLSAYTKTPLKNILARHRNTWTQTKLPSELRHQNTDNAFSVKKHQYLNKKFLIIIDDVTTSGSTISAAAQVLKTKYPHSQIWGLTVARG